MNEVMGQKKRLARVRRQSTNELVEGRKQDSNITRRKGRGERWQRQNGQDEEATQALGTKTAPAVGRCDDG